MLCYIQGVLRPSALRRCSADFPRAWAWGVRLKREGVDGRAPPIVKPASQLGPTQGNLPGPDVVRIMFTLLDLSLICQRLEQTPIIL